MHGSDYKEASSDVGQYEGYERWESEAAFMLDESRGRAGEGYGGGNVGGIFVLNHLW